MTQHRHHDVVGTERGYEWHRRQDEPACLACVEAHRRARRQQRDEAHPDTASARVPLWLLALLLDRVPSDTRRIAVHRLGAETTDRLATLTEETACWKNTCCAG